MQTGQARVPRGYLGTACCFFHRVPRSDAEKEGIQVFYQRRGAATSGPPWTQLVHQCTGGLVSVLQEARAAGEGEQNFIQHH